MEDITHLREMANELARADGLGPKPRSVAHACRSRTRLVDANLAVWQPGQAYSVVLLMSYVGFHEALSGVELGSQSGSQHTQTPADVGRC